MNIDFNTLQQWQQTPAPFALGTPQFWDDPHISSQMLAAHLNPNTSAASRKPAEIEQTVTWLMAHLGLHANSALLDLGCGPGLYAAPFAQRGMRVTGIDFSRRSIDYATQYAREHSLAITYRYQNYLTLNEPQDYDAALLIYGDFCVLAPEQRTRLLQNIHQALRAGGHFVLDVSTRPHRQRHGQHNSWQALQSGFWRPGPHLVLTQGFDYPEQSLYLDQYIVIEETGATALYRNWYQDYDAERITQELRAHGFHVQGLWNDLRGTPLSDDGEWIGVVAERV